MAKTGDNSSRAIATLVVAWIALPLSFLLTGGTLSWWQAWVYCGSILVPMTAFGLRMARRDPSFFDRRMKAKEKEQPQRRILAWGTPCIIAAYLLPGLDRRLGWSHPPLAVVVAAMLASACAYLAVIRVFMENRWAGRTVEVVPGQHIVSTGPYAIVRHPMYTMYTILQLATPLALGSWWGFIPSLAVIPMLILRIANEEQVLARDLPGYEEYRRAVPWRLVPYLW